MWKTHENGVRNTTRNFSDPPEIMNAIFEGSA